MEATENTKETQKDVVLTERQKEILTEAGLSADYEALSDGQKESIRAIEELLAYAEEKYGVTFKYAGYVAAGPMDQEHLTAYPSSGSMDDGCFTVTRTDDGIEDDYISVFASPKFSQYLQQELQKLLPDAQIRVYGRITRTSLTEIPEDGSVFDGTTAGSILVFADGAACTENSFRQMIENSEQFLHDHQIYSTVQFIRLKEGKIKYITGSNFEEYLSDDHYDAREKISIKQ